MALTASSQQVETDEPGDVIGTRAPSHLLRPTLLYHPAVLNDHEPIGEDGGINRVMRHEKRRAREITQVSAQLGAYEQAGLGIQRGQRLIQQEQPRVSREGTGQRHPLGLPSGDEPRLRSRQVSDADAGKPRRGPAPCLRLINSVYQRPERDVVEHAEVWKQQIVLKDHPDGPLVRLAMDV